MKRLGLIGLGAWGQRYLETVRRREDCSITTLARASEGTTWREVLELARSGRLDGVIVATTPDSQVQIAKATLSAGIPALVEKPLGLSRAVAESVLRGMPDPSPPLIVDYIHLYAPAYRRLKALVDGSAVVGITSEGENRGPFRGWSPLYDYGSHDAALCLDLLGVDSPFHLRHVRRLPSEAKNLSLIHI